MNNLVKYGSLVFLLLAACTRENPVEPEAMVETENPGVAGTLTAIYSPGTRTSYSNSTGVNFSWDATNESIAIMLNDRTTTTGDLTRDSEDYTRATVDYTLPSGKTRAYEAFYPASSFYSATLSGSTEYRNIVFPDEYPISDVVAGNGIGLNGRTYNTCNIPMYAQNTESDQLLFRHLGDLLRITCNNVPISTKKICVTGSSTIAGEIRYRYASGSYNGLEPYSVVSGSQQIYYTVSDDTNGLSSEVNGIVLNVPLPQGGSEYTGFKISALDKDDGILRQTLLAWNPDPTDPGRGYHRTATLTGVDNGVPFFQINFGGGTNQTGNEVTSGFKPELFLDAYNAEYLDFLSGTSTLKVCGHSDHITLRTISTGYYMRLTFSQAFKSAPKKVPSKIVVTCAANNAGKTIKLAYNDTGNSNGNNATIGSDGTYTWDINYTSNFEYLLISAGNNNTAGIDIYSIRIYL